VFANAGNELCSHRITLTFNHKNTATHIEQMCQSITSVEINEELSDSAKEKLNALNINNAQLTVGDGSQGWQSNDFFDVVIVGSAVPDITQKIL
jgi:protein-L-isoaspartate O-methyltransferase